MLTSHLCFRTAHTWYIICINAKVALYKNNPQKLCAKIIAIMQTCPVPSTSWDRQGTKVLKKCNIKLCINVI